MSELRMTVNSEPDLADTPEVETARHELNLEIGRLKALLYTLSAAKAAGNMKRHAELTERLPEARAAWWAAHLRVCELRITRLEYLRIEMRHRVSRVNREIADCRAEVARFTNPLKRPTVPFHE